MLWRSPAGLLAASDTKPPTHASPAAAQARAPPPAGGGRGWGRGTAQGAVAGKPQSEGTGDGRRAGPPLGACLPHPRTGSACVWFSGSRVERPGAGRPEGSRKSRPMGRGGREAGDGQRTGRWEDTRPPEVPPREEGCDTAPPCPGEVTPLCVCLLVSSAVDTSPGGAGPP